MTGETQTVEMFDKDIQNLYSHYRKIAKKYKMTIQQVTLMFASLDIKSDLGVIELDEDAQ